jgi:hypothetical protein
LKLGDFSIFWVFLSKFGPKNQYFWKFSQMQPKDRFGLATSDLYTCKAAVVSNWEKKRNLFVHYDKLGLP